MGEAISGQPLIRFRVSQLLYRSWPTLLQGAATLNIYAHDAAGSACSLPVPFRRMFAASID